MTDWDNIFAKKENSSSSVDNPSSTISVPDATSPQIAVEVKPEVAQQPQELEQKPKEPTSAKPGPEGAETIREVSDEGGEVYTIYGNKGNGKTFLCYSFPGDIAVLSFDGKSYSIKKHQYDNEERIRVYNAREKLDETSAEAWLRTSDLTLRHVNNIVEQLSNGTLPKPDWIVIDGQDAYTQISEMTMRYRNNLQPYQGIPNPSIWKERRQYLRQLHYSALKAAKRGIIYTVYIDSKPSQIVAGNVVQQREKPKWLDVVESESDIVLKVESDVTENGSVYNCYVDSSKTRMPLNNSSKFDISKYEYGKDGTPTERPVWGIKSVFPDID